MSTLADHLDGLMARRLQDGRDDVTYRDQNGREDTVSASAWATWCRAAVRKSGGSYDRAPEATA